LALATFLVWRLRTGACGVGACGFWRYRMPPHILPAPIFETDIMFTKKIVSPSPKRKKKKNTWRKTLKIIFYD